MDLEIQLLRLIDAVTNRYLETAPANGRIPARACSKMAASAKAVSQHAAQLALHQTTGCADALEGELRALKGRGSIDASRVEHLLEELQLVADKELERRLHAVSFGAPPAPAASLTGQQRESLRDFLVESREHLQAAERHAMELEQDPGRLDSLHAIFRAFHTIKGLAGINDLAGPRQLAHELESVLDLARDGALVATPPLIDLVLAASDRMLAMLDSVESHLGGAALEIPEWDEVAVRLRELLDPDAARPAAPPNRALAEPAKPDESSARSGQAASDLRELAGGETSSGRAAESTSPEPGLQPQRPSATREEPPPAAAPQQAPASGVVKIDTAKLDHVVDMVGELVIAQSLVQMDAARSDSNPSLQRSLAQMGRITNDLQKTAMSMRLVPVGQVFQRMQRAFRDLVKRAGKQARIEIAGEDAELDRTIVEQLADPLLHMVRNSVDHGLEPPGERTAAGKPAEGLFRLAASHQSGQIVIEVADDGRGIDPERVLRKAQDRGLVKPDALPAGDAILDLIFEPGFSTAEKVTDVSGRGVGMDVVRKQIQRLRGRVEIHSTLGEGTRFMLRLPLTLAIIDGLVVRVGTERYILPLFSVSEIFQPEPGAVFTVEGRHEVVLIRDRATPVLKLGRLLRPGAAGDMPRGGSVMVVVEVGGGRYCIEADGLLGKQQVVLKSLGGGLGHLPGISGGAILGDGTVGLILDLEGLLHRQAAHAA